MEEEIVHEKVWQWIYCKRGIRCVKLTEHCTKQEMIDEYFYDDEDAYYYEALPITMQKREVQK